MFNRLIEKVRQLLTTRPKVGGLEISHASLKYLAIRGSRSIQQASLKLPPGIIEGGKSANTEQLIAAFKSLHSQIAPPSIPLSVVLIIPSSLVYTQAFAVPMMKAGEQEEAIDLNLQMISPGKIEESYYDWQEIKKNETAGHLDLLGAFANSFVIDEFVSALTSANFNVVSVEFPGLSLSRLVKERWQNPAIDGQQLLIYINGEGLLVSILENANLYFADFTPWSTIVSKAQTQEIVFADVQSFMTQEIQRVLTFFLGRTGHSLTSGILISPMFNFEIVQIAEQKFSLTMKNLTITELPELSPTWFPVLGAGLRGLIARSKDTFLSLSKISAKTEYFQERTLSLMALGRNIIVGMLIFIFLAYLTVDAVLYRSEASHGPQETLVSLVDEKEVLALRTGAETFNKLTELALIAKAKEENWSPVLSAIQEIAGTSIAITRIFADRTNLTLLIAGTATNELAAINFKGRVERIPNMKSVSLPLNQIRTDEQGGVLFTLTATLNAL